MLQKSILRVLRVRTDTVKVLVLIHQVRFSYFGSVSKVIHSIC